MSKKKNTHWELAFGGTNVLPPFRNGWPKPWPQWLQKTFVNLHLLQQDPIDLRSELITEHHPDNAWGIVDNLLWSIETHAKEQLKLHPLPEHLQVLMKTQSLLDEGDFWDHFGYEKLTPKQKNAIAALRSVQVIRSFSHTIDNGGYLMSDPRGNHQYESLTVAKLITETVLMVMSSMRGELFELWNHVDFDFKREQQFARQAQINKSRAIDIDQRIIMLATKYRQATKSGTVRMIRQKWSQESLNANHPTSKPPSYGRCQPVVSALFEKSRKLTKPPTKGSRPRTAKPSSKLSTSRR